MIPKRSETATVLLLLAPLSSGFGLWLIFQAGILIGSSAVDVVTGAETGLGVCFFILGVPLFFTSIGVFASRDRLEAEKWVRWLGRLKPKIENGDRSPVSSVSSEPVLWSLRVPLVLLRPRHRNKWIHPHLLPKTRRLYSCDNHDGSKHWDYRTRRPRIIASLSSNIENNCSNALGASASYPVSFCFLENASR